MPWGSNTWIRLTKEATYGVRPTSPPASDVMWFRIYSDNGFGLRPVPQRQVIRSADAGNRRRQVASARTVYAGSLATLFYPSQASYVFGAATTLTSNDLSSYCVDFFDSVRVQGYLGAKFQQLQATTTATQDFGTLGISLVAQRLDSTFSTLAQPADTVFPTELPYEHFESGSNVSIGGATISKYRSLSVTIKNILAGTWDELPYISGLYYAGRDVDFALEAQYNAATMRTNYESQAALAATLKWSRSSPANSVTLNCQSKNYIASIGDDLRLDYVGYQALSFETFYDGSAGSDLAVTVV